MIVANAPQFGHTAQTFFASVVTTRTKRTNRRQIDQIRWQATNRGQASTTFFIESWDGTEQSNRIRHTWIGENLTCWTFFNNFTGIHDRHPISHTGNNTKVVGDQDHCGFKLFTQAIDQLKNLGLNGDIEGCRWLIGNQ
jgi:hypothetical protein